MARVHYEDLPDSPDELDKFNILKAGFHDCVIESHKIHDSEDPDTAPDVIEVRLRVQEGACKGQTHNERIKLPFPGEKDGAKKNRQIFLLKTGVISENDFKAGTRCPIDYDALPIDGKGVTVEITHNEGSKKDADGKPKIYANVAFGGWHAYGFRPAPKAQSGGNAAAPFGTVPQTQAAPAAPQAPARKATRDFSQI
jgi:hypothetical protein